MRRTFQGRDGELRLYELGTGAGTHYLKVYFSEMTATGAIARNRPTDDLIVTVGGFTHAPSGPAMEEALYGPIPVEFSFNINSDDWNKMRPALCNPDLLPTWTVGAHNWHSTKGKGSIILFDGTYYATQPFSDTQKVTVDIYSRWNIPISGSAFGICWREAYLNPGSMVVGESADFVQLKCSALVYGDVRHFTEFPGGSTES